MPDYARTIIYKIVCKDVNITKSYGGHTTHIIKRKQNHKSICNNINSNKYNRYVYQFIRKNGNWDNWEMIWQYDFPCKSKREAELEERNFIEINKCELNCIRPYVSEDEKKEESKEYRENNKSIIKEKAKDYRENNKDKSKDYYQEKAKEFYKKNKDKVLEKAKQKITCECGCEINKSSLLTHKKTDKHKKLMTTISPLL